MSTPKKSAYSSRKAERMLARGTVRLRNFGSDALSEQLIERCQSWAKVQSLPSPDPSVLCRRGLQLLALELAAADAEEDPQVRQARQRASVRYLREAAAGVAATENSDAGADVLPSGRTREEVRAEAERIEKLCDQAVAEYEARTKFRRKKAAAGVPA